jgi:hypothetical protein
MKWLVGFPSFLNFIENKPKIKVNSKWPQMTQAGILLAQHAVLMHTCKMNKVRSNQKLPKSLK